MPQHAKTAAVTTCYVHKRDISEFERIHAMYEYFTNNNKAEEDTNTYP